MVGSMEHARIWIQIVTLILGTWTFFYTHQIRRDYRFRFLKPLESSIILFNGMILAGLISNYIHFNFFQDTQAFKASGIPTLISPFSLIFFVGLVYALTRFSDGFLGRKTPSSVHFGFGIGGFLIIGTFTLYELLFCQSAALRWILWPAVVLYIAILLILVGNFIRFILFGFKTQDMNKKRIALAFGFFYLIMPILLIGSKLFLKEYHRLVDGILLLSCNNYLFFWIKFVLLKYSNALPTVVEEEDINLISNKFGISNRQREIVQLLLHGKSNREIANTLFIAPHTVKNHLYSLYQKLGVKSRYELVNFFLEHAGK